MNIQDLDATSGSDTRGSIAAALRWLRTLIDSPRVDWSEGQRQEANRVHELALRQYTQESYGLPDGLIPETLSALNAAVRGTPNAITPDQALAVVVALRRASADHAVAERAFALVRRLSIEGWVAVTAEDVKALIADSEAR
jgi:hypothetical protein